MSRFNQNQGYTLLFAVITAALVLSVGVFILGVSKKQYTLSISARESMYALYAADSALECAAREYYYNTPNDHSGTGFAITDSGAPHTPSLRCNNQLNTPVAIGFATNSSPDSQLWQGNTQEAGPIKVLFAVAGETSYPCALIYIAYGADAKPPHDTIVRVTSRGYNQCDGAGPLPSNRTVERALRLTASN